jgi:hypothetical protein
MAAAINWLSRSETAMPFNPNFGTRAAEDGTKTINAKSWA